MTLEATKVTMEGSSDDAPDYYGSLVAFEGHSETISTQLRLLPSSSNIMILPALQNFMEQEETETQFNARSYVLRIHEACMARAELALSFLCESSPENKRLVFMNGGTASAQMDCITAISQHETHGNIAKAVELFKDLARNGVAGLLGQGATESINTSEDAGEEDEEPTDLPSDPISRAMRAAEALDQATASLQPDTDIDLTAMTRRRSMSLPLRRMAMDLEHTAPFYVFGNTDGDDRSPEGRTAAKTSQIPPLPSLPDLWENLRTRNPELFTRESKFLGGDKRASNMANHAGMPCGALLSPKLASVYYDMFSPRTTMFGSMPSSPKVVYGEALVVDVRSSPTDESGQVHRRVKSVDRIYASGIPYQDISLCRHSQFLTPDMMEDGLARSRMVSGDSSEALALRSGFPSEIIPATFVKPTTTTIRRSPSTGTGPAKGPPCYLDKGTSTERQARYSDRETWIGARYVNRGADAEEFESVFSDSSELGADDDETVLPMIEDLVIHFQDEMRNPMLESIIQGFKDGTYPITMSSEVEEDDDNRRSKESTSSFQREEIAMEEMQDCDQTPMPTNQKGDEEYDPFASHGDYLHSSDAWPLPATKENRPTLVVSAPPTPAQTPPPTMTPKKGFHDFLTTNCKTAVCVQNSLRSILNIYFSPEDTGYQQLNFPLLPELSSLWKPVFREAEAGSNGKDGRKIDLILAIGAQRGVSKEFFSTISGSLEKLGAKASGISRSGRLDLRYLIANAMQAFTAQPLTSQTHDNPFTNTLLLATLVIPHLETYMAAHSETRFLLLEFPPDHLSTVMALQRLMGVDLLKIAGILNADSPESNRSPVVPPANGHSAAPSVSSVMSSRTGTTLFAGSGSKPTEPPSFSKANFLLTSSATESEIAILISTIWRILIDVSPFYIPDGVPKQSIPRNFKHGVTQDSGASSLVQTSASNPASEYAPFASAAVMMGFQAPPVPPKTIVTAPVEDLPPPPPGPHTPVRLHSSQASISETIRSGRTARTTASRKTKLNKLLGAGTDDDSSSLRPPTRGSYFDVSDDEEGRFAAEERKYMPLFNKKSEVRKGNSRKALKWLGLA